MLAIEDVFGKMDKKHGLVTWLDDDIAKNNKAKDNDMKNTHVDITGTMKGMTLDDKADQASMDTSTWKTNMTSVDMDKTMTNDKH